MTDASPEAVSLIASFEGFRSMPYQDVAGVWTIGYGSTRDATGEPVSFHTQAVTQKSALALLSRDAHSAAQAVVNDVKVPLTADEDAALTDFVYNLGSGAFLTSTLLRLLNAGDYAGAEAQFDAWDRAGGRVVHGLLLRRQKEAALFGHPSAASVSPPEAPADEDAALYAEYD